MRTFIFNSSNVVSGSNNSKYRVIVPNIKFLEGEKVAISSIVIPYSWYNFNQSKYNNCKFDIVYDSTTYNVLIPDGFYTTEVLNQYLQYFCIENGLYLVNSAGDNVYYLEFEENTAQYKIQINCYPVPNALPVGWSNPATLALTGYTPQITILSNNFRNIIGFSAGTYPSSDTETTNQSFVSTSLPNLSPVNSLLLNCNLANNECSAVYPNLIYNFAPNVQFGSQIVINPPCLNWIDIQAGIYQYLEIWMTDQNGNSIDINDYNVVFQILIKARGE